MPCELIARGRTPILSIVIESSYYSLLLNRLCELKKDLVKRPRMGAVYIDG